MDTNMRDTLRRQYDAICVEMEAAGLMNNFPCLVIRGISDYADSHKNPTWKRPAAGSAAAFAKALLKCIPPEAVAEQKPVEYIMNVQNVPTVQTQSLPRGGEMPSFPNLK